DQRVPDRSRSQDDVDVGEKGLQTGPWDGFPVKTLRQLAGPWMISIHDTDIGTRSKRLCGDPSHLPCPDDGDDSMLEGEDRLEESNGRVARRRFVRVEPGNRSDGGSDSGGLEKHASQGAVRADPSRSARRGVPDLRRHLLLAFREGVEAAGNPNEMSRRIAVVEDVENRLVGGDAEGVSNVFGRPRRGVRDCVHFDSIARRQEDEVGPRWPTSARLPQGSVRGLPEKPLTRVEARGSMIGPDDKEVSRGGERGPIGAMWERGRLAIHRLANRATRLAYKNVRADDSHHKDNFGGLTQPNAPRQLPHRVGSQALRWTETRCWTYPTKPPADM